MKGKNVYVMCPPQHSDVSNIISPWMKANIRALDNALAKGRWRALCDIVFGHATVRPVLSQLCSPDMVFTANAGLVLRDRVIVSRFRYPERQYEEPYFAYWFVNYRFEVMPPRREVPFEGAGDALFERDTRRGKKHLWMACGRRSSLGAKDYIEKWLKCKMEALQLVDDRLYHFEACRSGALTSVQIEAISLRTASI